MTPEEFKNNLDEMAAAGLVHIGKQSVRLTRRGRSALYLVEDKKEK